VSDPTNPATWTALHTGLAVALPCLLAGSAFFSGSETALFGLSARDRIDLASAAGDRCAALQLLRAPRSILITLLLGNMVTNVLYFALVSVLAWHQPWGAIGAAAIPIAALLAIVLFAEVAPKMVASARTVGASRLVGPPLLAVHRLLLPISTVLDLLLIQPLSRLATPPQPVEQLSLGELDELIAASGSEGLVDAAEQRLLADVIALDHTPVSDVMTPRTRMVGIQLDATEDDIRATIQAHGYMRIPVYRRDLDDIAGFLHVKDWLRASGPIEPLLRTGTYIPEVTTVGRALEVLRQSKRQTAVVVDEFGGTAGVVSLHDLIEPLIGDIADDASRPAAKARPLGPGRWIVPGDFPADRLLGAIAGPEVDTGRARTVGGLVTSRIGRIPEAGDQVIIGNITIEVHHATAGAVETAIVSAEEGAS
jgi:CBS domain containing-hemolysin-like protein